MQSFYGVYVNHVVNHAHTRTLHLQDLSGGNFYSLKGEIIQIFI